MAVVNEDPEIARIQAEFRRRDREVPRNFYAFYTESGLFALQELERSLRRGLSRAGVLPLRGAKMLEVGCGTGALFATFARFGLDLHDLSAIELDADRLAAAKRLAPEAELRLGNAAELPWPDSHFDVVFQSTVFTSILDSKLKAEVAREMLRVLKPGGVVVWYDFAVDNPFNRQVKGVPRRELRALFAGYRVDARKVTLLPPLARRLVRLSWTAAALLQSTKLLNTHLLAVVYKPHKGAS